MRLFVQDETRVRIQVRAPQMSPAVFENLVVGHLAEHGLAKIVWDMKGTEQSKWLGANESNRRVEIERQWRERKGAAIGALHARNITTTEAARILLTS